MNKQRCPWIQCPNPKCGKFIKVHHNTEMPNVPSWFYRCMCGENKHNGILKIKVAHHANNNIR